MQNTIIAMAVALIALPALAGGGAANVSASSTSITGASVYINGTGTASAGAFDRSGAGASSSSHGHYQHNSVWAHSDGGSFAMGTHTGPGVTQAEAYEFSQAKAKAGHKRAYDQSPCGYSCGE